MARIKKVYTATIYLIHLSQKLAHSQHYIGYTIRPVDDRLSTHKSGNGSKMLAHCNKVGIDYTIVRTWTVTAPTKQAVKNAGLNFEQNLKRRKNAPCLCPQCKAAKTKINKSVMKCLTKTATAFLPIPVINVSPIRKELAHDVRLTKPVIYTGLKLSK